jgi:hypothetical protein
MSHDVLLVWFRPGRFDSAKELKPTLAKIKNPRSGWNGGRPASVVQPKPQAASVDNYYAHRDFGRKFHCGRS